jgi:O-methyltransferase
MEINNFTFVKFLDALRIFRINIRRESSKAIRKIMAPPGTRELPPKYPQDFSSFSCDLWDKVAPHTMTSKERVINLEYAVRHIHTAGISGDCIECGVGEGGSMMVVAFTLIELGDTSRHLWLYDTYEGMAEPTAEDVSNLGKPAKRKYDRKVKDGKNTYFNYPIELVKENMRTTGYPETKISYPKGLVQDTLPDNSSDTIAILRLDTNYYESTCAEMQHLYPKLAVGGILLIDDYYRWRGQRKAIDEYLAGEGHHVFFSRIDDHSAIGIKQDVREIH